MSPYCTILSRQASLISFVSVLFCAVLFSVELVVTVSSRFFLLDMLSVMCVPSHIFISSGKHVLVMFVLYSLFYDAVKRKHICSTSLSLFFLLYPLISSSASVFLDVQEYILLRCFFFLFAGNNISCGESVEGKEFPGEGGGSIAAKNVTTFMGGSSVLW